MFHVLLFIFYRSHGITHSLLIFKCIRELKVRQIDHNIISGWWFNPIMAISSVYFLIFYGSDGIRHENNHFRLLSKFSAHGYFICYYLFFTGQM
jgi:hypothetical protein